MNRRLSRATGSALLWVTAAGCLFVSTRLRAMGSWQPELPTRVGDWVATEIPLTMETRTRLGNPRARSLVYRNSHGESVVVHAVAPTGFQGFGELPTIATDYRVIAARSQALPGRQRVAWASAHESLQSPGFVLHALRWLQVPSGDVYPFEPDSGSGPIQRLRRGFGVLFRDTHAAAIHITTLTSGEGAPSGQVRRNLLEIASAVLDQGTRPAGTHP